MLLAGDGPDVLLLDGLPAQSYIDKGLLEDLSPMINPVRAELMPNILSAYTVEDQIYMLPLRLQIPVFLLTGQDESVYSDLESIVEYSEQEGGVTPPGFTYSDFLQILYYNYTPELVSETGQVDRAAVSEFLGLVKRFCESEQASEEIIWVGTYMEGRNVGMMFASGDADFGFTVVNGGYSLGVDSGAVAERGGKIVGNQGIFFPNALVGVNRMSTKKEASRLFVEFAFSREIQERSIYSGYPIFTEILDEYAKIDRSGTILTSGTPGNLLYLRYFTQEEAAEMIQIVKEVQTPFTVEESVWEIISEVGESYLKGTKSLEESADEIASRLQLYFDE